MHSSNQVCAWSVHPSFDMMVRNMPIAVSDCTVNLTSYSSELQRLVCNLLHSSSLLKRNSFHCRLPSVESLFPVSLWFQDDFGSVRQVNVPTCLIFFWILGMLGMYGLGLGFVIFVELVHRLCIIKGQKCFPLFQSVVRVNAWLQIKIIWIGISTTNLPRLLGIQRWQSTSCVQTSQSSFCAIYSNMSSIHDCEGRQERAAKAVTDWTGVWLKQTNYVI